MPLHVELVSPERVLLSTEASMVLARTIGGGDIAFLPGHAPFIGALATWVVEIVPARVRAIMAAVHGGFISITDDSVKILSDLAELADGIDAARAQAALERAEAAARRGRRRGRHRRGHRRGGPAPTPASEPPALSAHQLRADRDLPGRTRSVGDRDLVEALGRFGVAEVERLERLDQDA